MKKKLPAVIALLLLGIDKSALAADLSAVLPAKAPPSSTLYDWTGFYAGGSAGVAWGRSDWNAGPGLTGTTDLYHPINMWDEGGSWFVGLQGGYNYMFPNRVVLGAEVDERAPSFPTLNGIQIGGISNLNSPTQGPSTFSESVLASGTVRGRIGYAAGNVLFYGTGGFAWTYNQQVLTNLSNGNTDMPLLWRLGWAAGVGVEYAFMPHWTVRAEYLVTDYGNYNHGFFDGAQPITSDFMLQEFSVGLNYHFANGATPGNPSSPLVFKAKQIADEDLVNIHGQSTFTWQGYPAFRSPYQGAQSLPSGGIGRETADATLYAGIRLWQGAEFWVNPEMDQGHGLAETHGAAGFPSAEAYKLGYDDAYARLDRYFVRQTINLGGDTQKVDADINQFESTQTANRLVLTVGKFAVVDIFDTNKYANNPKSDFLNWSVVNAGTFDYAADAFGYTYGAAAEWYEGRFTLRAGAFDMSAAPTGGADAAPGYGLDPSWSQQQFIGEIEERHELWGEPGKIKVTVFDSHARTGDYDDALALANNSSSVWFGDVNDALASIRVSHNRPGVSLNIEQSVTDTVGFFARAGWANGDYEPMDFTDIDRTVAAGLSVTGKNWGRPDDTFAIAGVTNGVSSAHEAWLNDGGMGILIGDGPFAAPNGPPPPPAYFGNALPNYGLEHILETYYNYAANSWMNLTFDYQFIDNPGYNADRGPVNVFSGRVHVAF